MTQSPYKQVHKWFDCSNGFNEMGEWRQQKWDEGYQSTISFKCPTGKNRHLFVMTSDPTISNDIFHNNYLMS